jgi:hypothetical protein
MEIHYSSSGLGVMAFQLIYSNCCASFNIPIRAASLDDNIEATYMRSSGSFLINKSFQPTEGTLPLPILGPSLKNGDIRVTSRTDLLRSFPD